MITENNEIQMMNSVTLLEAWLWGVEPANSAELENELVRRGIDTVKVAAAVGEFTERVAKGDSVAAPVLLPAKFGGSCFICGRPFSKGENINHFRDGEKGKRACHADCWNALKKAIKDGSKPEATKETNGDGGDLAAVIARAISDHLPNRGVDEAVVRKIVADEFANRKEVIHTVKIGSVKVDATGQHKLFPKLLAVLANQLNVFLVGPAGGGKTRAAMAAAEALNKKFYCMSVGPQTTMFHITGYMDSQGKYVRTLFREAYEHGGVFLYDELDAGSPSVLTVLNAALDGKECAFPDKMVPKHPEFQCVAAGNTYGLGANRVYVGRNQLDGATLERFAFLEWGYDEEAELRWASNTEWTKWVQACRKAAEEEQVRHIISPRASINGSKLLAAGISREEVADMLLWKGISTEARKRIEARARA